MDFRITEEQELMVQAIEEALTRENLAKEHDLDHVDKLDLLACHIFDIVLESGQLRRCTPG